MREESKLRLEEEQAKRTVIITIIDLLIAITIFSSLITIIFFVILMFITVINSICHHYHDYRDATQENMGGYNTTMTDLSKLLETHTAQNTRLRDQNAQVVTSNLSLSSYFDHCDGCADIV